MAGAAAANKTVGVAGGLVQCAGAATAQSKQNDPFGQQKRKRPRTGGLDAHTFEGVYTA